MQTFFLKKGYLRKVYSKLLERRLWPIVGFRRNSLVFAQAVEQWTRSLPWGVRSSASWRELRVEPLLLCIERSQLRWSEHLVRMPSVRLLSEVFRVCPTERRPKGSPRTRWKNYISLLTWEHLGIPKGELENVAGEKEEFLYRICCLRKSYLR